MLILSRKVSERIHIGDDIIVTVTRIYPHSKVRLAIQAPEDVKIMRTELLPNPKPDEESDAQDQNTLAGFRIRHRNRSKTDRRD